MKSIEFVTRIHNKTIAIPDNIDIKGDKEKVRVIVLIEEGDNEEILFKQVAQDNFLSGFSEPDSIYDKN